MPLVPYLSYTDKHFETAKRFYFLHGPFQIKAVNKISSRLFSRLQKLRKDTFSV